ncbi:hypothetical protein RJ53_08840 [Methanocalculus chunghsingensis]|uniref:Rhodanese domain-containing protein n=1 Tax=Methanocalculus chunghsingensis TaxID=156457 RepID=A0A8J7WAX3_9EURY|nr:rhodanese-like domain-containing protein [Methanocalculus chunghsingensis]MBR1369587.1 hypothetical protein [Methanocalculus chunghsingensis]
MIRRRVMGFSCIVLLLLIAAAGCTAPDGGDEMPVLQTITAEEAMLLIEAKPAITIIDVRTVREYEAGHIPGAVHIPIASSFHEGIAGLDRDQPYLVYCATGVRGSRALRAMGEAGFAEVYNLGGGIAAWEKAGGAVI